METKNSGDNITYEGWVKRENKAWKLRYDLIPLEQLKRLAGLYTRWAEVYGDRNWENGFMNQEYIDKCKQSAWRHFISWQAWETDEDHAMWCAWNIFAYEELTRLKAQAILAANK